MSPDDRRAGSLVGSLLCNKWRLERLLGRGGMSSVYAAVHRNGNRVAIKVLSPELTANPAVRQRFLREGYAANRVGHEGAVKVLDDDVAEGDVVFLVMELLEGETLAARAHRLGGKLVPGEVAAAASALLEVLARAHSNGIVHRDVKPANVFLTRTGQTKLLDFGIASLGELGGVGSTRPGSRLGTPGFMAPEQARGRWEAVDARTDLWAVGATMFSLLAGRPVHGGETEEEAIIAAATTEAPSLGAVAPGLPPVLVAVVDRALRLDPAVRWQSAEQCRGALEEARRRLPAPVWDIPAAEEGHGLQATLSEVIGSVPVPAAPQPAPAGGLARRKHTRALLAVAGAVIAVVGAAGAWRGRPRVPTAPPSAPAPPDRTEAPSGPASPAPAAPAGIPAPRGRLAAASGVPAAHRGGARDPVRHAPGPVHPPPTPGAPTVEPPRSAPPGLHELLNQRR
jgi:eukaryotic-like serine/threonine-protein kinase